MSENHEETPSASSYERVRKLISSAGSDGSGKYFDQLTSAEQTLVRRFIDHLKSETTMTSASVSSYKSYVTKMILWERGALGRDLTNDEKSGSRKFIKWYDAHVQASEDEEE